MIQVNVPGLGTVQFADGTPQSVMQAAIQRALASKENAKPPMPSSRGLDTSNTVAATPGPKAEARRLREQRTREMQAMGGLPTAEADTLGPDPGAIMPAVRQGADLSLGFLFGLPEKVGLAPEGTRAQMKADLYDERQRALEHGHVGAQVAGLAGGLASGLVLPTTIGRAAAAGSKLGPIGARVLGGAAGASEGAFQGWADSDSLASPTPLPANPSITDRLANAASNHPVLFGAGLGAAGGAVGGGSAARARIEAMKARVNDTAAQLAAPPPPRTAGPLWAEYNMARTAVDDELTALVQQAAGDGVEVPPQAIEQLRAAKHDALTTQWHERTTTQAALSNEPGVHTLADATEQLSPFTPASIMPDADLIALRDASLRIAEVESRPERVYRGTQLFSDNPNSRTYIYRDPNTGEEIGYLLAHPEEGGFKVKNVWVEESHRGASIPEHLFTKASEELGPLKGSTDYAGRATAAGTKMAERLKRTVPHVFTAEGSGQALVPPTSALIRAADPKRSVKQILTDTANRFVEEFSDKQEPVIRVLRNAGLGERANEMSLWLSQARGAPRVAANTIWKGVRHWDAVSGNTTRAYDSLNSIIGGVGETGWRDLNDLLAAENHMELVGRKAAADTEYAGALAARRAEIEARRAAVIGARGDTRRATSQGRNDLATLLKATRREGKASGELGARSAVAEAAQRRADTANEVLLGYHDSDMRAALRAGDNPWIGEEGGSLPDVATLVSSRTQVRAEGRQQGKRAANERIARDSSIAANRAFVNADAEQANIANLPKYGDVLDVLTGATKKLEVAATARYQKLPPLVQRPPDSTLKLDPRGTAWARAKQAELQQRYGPETSVVDSEIDILREEMGLVKGQTSEVLEQIRQSKLKLNPPTGVAQLSEVARRIREWSWAAVVEQLDQVGYFTPEGKAALAAKRQQFAPFARLADEVTEDLGLTTGTHAKPVARISGGLSPDKPIAEPLESFVAQAQRIQLWVERQRVFNQLGDAAEAFPAELGDMIKRLPPNSRNGFQVFRDGVRHVYSAPDDVLRALGNADSRQVPWLLQAATLAARSLRAGVTLSPDFAARNFVRDQATAGVLGAEFKYRPFSDFMTGLWAQTPFASPKLRDMVWKWESAGGALGDIISIERPQATVTGKAAAGIIDPASLLPGAKSHPIRVGKFVAKTVSEWHAEKGLGRILFPFLRPLEGAASTVENATRIGAFARAQSKGANELASSYFARNITLDFGRSGATAQRWNSVEAFANASLQDVARFSKAMKTDPAGTTIKALTYITLPALATYALHRDNQDYQARPEWEKASFYHMFQRDDKSWVMFPRPLGMLNLIYGYGIERMFEAMRGKYDEPVTELLSTVFNETPARYLPFHPDPDPNAATRGSYEWMPTIMQPIAEVSAGEEGWSDFRRSPIVPRSLIELLPEDRHTDTTSEAAKAIGGAVGQAPLKIDHLIRNFGGTLAVQGLRLAERAAGAGQLPELPMTANDMPVAGAFVSGNPYGFSTQPAQDFYAMEEAAHEASNSLEAAAERLHTDPDKYYRIIRTNPEALIADELASIKRDLAQLRKTRNEYRTIPGLSPEVRAERILQTDMLISQTTTATMHWVAQWRQGYLDARRKAKKP